MSRRFLFSGITRKYKVSYVLVRKTEGHYNEAGKWVPGGEENVTLRGVIQPLDAQLTLDERGKYTLDDRRLITLYKHTTGERILYQGLTYTIDAATERSYRDENTYMLKKVVIR